MSFAAVGAGVAVIGAGLNIGGKLYSGAQAGKVDNRAAQRGAQGIAAEERALAGREFGAAMTGLQSNFDLGMKGAGLKAGQSLTSLSQSMSGAYSKSGFATSGQIAQQGVTGKKNVWDSFNLKQEGMQSTLDLGKERASISQQKSLGAIEQRLQGRLDQISMTPDTFGEGFWGTSNGKVG